MPAKQNGPANGGWGITYADVGEAMDQYEAHHSCTVEWSVYRYKKHKKSPIMVWSVVCHARYRRDTPQEVRGWGTCEVGSGSGAASMPGAYLRAMLDACEDLEKRKASPRKALETARLPGFGER